MHEEARRFKYNMDLERALCNLLGRRYYGSAGAFSDPRVSKKFLLRATRRIRRTLKEIITTDERLLLTTDISLNSLERHIKATSERVNNDWFIIANMLKLISLLLGYDWADGKVHRHVFFYQEKHQEVQDYMNKIGRKFWDEFPTGDWRIRYEIVYLLNEVDTPKNQIARVLGISDDLVTRILKRIDDFESTTGKKFLEHSKQLRFDFFSA